MLLKILEALLSSPNNRSTDAVKKATGKAKLTPKEKSRLEYELWVRAEEYEDGDE
jgi:hypothetical protein